MMMMMMMYLFLPYVGWRSGWQESFVMHFSSNSLFCP
uniref:Uncharacterized protein n=1 Tax=Rhizophora mucronata TaxID=61149 RepID=A0A2P2PD54_RHIMU